MEWAMAFKDAAEPLSCILSYLVLCIAGLITFVGFFSPQVAVKWAVIGLVFTCMDAALQYMFRVIPQDEITVGLFTAWFSLFLGMAPGRMFREHRFLNSLATLMVSGIVLLYAYLPIARRCGAW